MELLRVISEFQALGFLLVTAVGTFGSLWFQWQNSRRLKGAAENIQKVETATNSLMEQARLAAHAAGIEVGRIAAEAAAMTASTLAADAAAIVEQRAEAAAHVLNQATDRAADVVRQAAEALAQTTKTTN